MAHLDYYKSARDILEVFRNSQLNLIQKLCIEFNCPERVDELSTKYVDASARLKKFKDPKAPKKPKTSYMFFCAEQRLILKEVNDNLSFSEIMKELSKKWKSLSEEEKERYNSLAEEDKERYSQETDKYNDSLYSPQC